MNRQNLQNAHPKELRHYVSEGFFGPVDVEPMLFKFNKCSVRVKYEDAVEVFTSDTPIVWEQKYNIVDIYFLNGTKSRVLSLPNVESIEYIS